MDLKSQGKMTIEEARELVNGPLWSKVRDAFLASGEFEVIPSGDIRRLAYLDEAVRKKIDDWLEVLERAEELRKVVAGAEVKALKSRYPGAYPEALKFSIYFTRFKRPHKDDAEAVKLLMKLKFPEAYGLCCS